MLDYCLPICRRAVDIAQQVSKDPWSDVAHSAHDHFIAARANFCKTLNKQSTRTGFIDEPCDISCAITNQRHYVAHQRRVNKFAVIFGVNLRRFKKEK